MRSTYDVYGGINSRRTGLGSGTFERRHSAQRTFSRKGDGGGQGEEVHIV